MFSPLQDRTYRHLFAAQLIALIGTGIATVALGLLAYHLAGPDAGLVLGTALAIKMVAYVGVSPAASVFAEWLPRRGFLIALDAARAVIVLLLPLVDQIWQIYVLVFLLQSASAAFTPAFQATIPDILPDEAEYTKALSLSRLAYDLENLISPALAAALLTVAGFHWLFAGTAIGFVLSALLVRSVVLPALAAGERGSGFYERATKGVRYYLATPRLRGLLALNLAAAAAGAMVLVNTVVYVRGILNRDDTDVALALAVFGAGSMAAALTLPRLLERISDRLVMLCGAAGLVLGLIGNRHRLRRRRGRLDDVSRCLARPGPLLFVRADAFRPAAPALFASRGPAGAVRRAIRPVARVLDGDISARRLAGRGIRHGRCRLRAGGARGIRNRCGASLMAGSRSRNRGPCSQRTSR